MPVLSDNQPGSAQDRMAGAIVGQFLGDALSLGSHWHYDLAKRAEFYPDGIQGFEPPVTDYHKKRQPGDFTHYGDAGMVLLQSIVGVGHFDHRDYGRRLVETFSDPDYPGYVDKATRATIEHALAADALSDGADFDWQQGADDRQTGTASRLAPIVVRHADDADLDRLLEWATRVCQNNDEAVAYALTHGRILRSVIAGAELPAAIEAAADAAQGPSAPAIRQNLSDARKMIEHSVSDATGEFGRACYLSSTFPSSQHAVLKHGGDVATCLLETVRAGGDNASRASMVGAWLGASHGLSGLPADWVERLCEREPLLELTSKLVGMTAH